MTPTILVTGATDGLGRAVARELAGRGATVLVHGRDPERLEAVATELGGRAYRADFSSLAEVGALAEAVLAAEPRLDALVNNAGIGATMPGDGVRLESADGHELRFAVNYLAPYLLTRLLLPLLERSAPARIVNVSSAAQTPLDFSDVMLERSYDGMRAYSQSKLAQVLFTRDLGEELADRDVTATALHPATDMPTKMVVQARRSVVSTLEEGVAATVRLVADPALDGVTRAYFDGQHEAAPDPQADDPEARRRLRELSRALTGV